MIRLMNSRFRGVFFATLAGVGMAVAGEVMAPSFSVTTNHVEEGASVVQADRVLVSPEAVLRKTGGGAWKIPLTYLAQTWPAVFDVEEGTLEFGLGSQSGSYASPTTLPDSIAAKALIWVDAADPVASHIAETDAGVSVWYDRREGVDVSYPSYCRASAYTGHTTTLPVRSTVDGDLPAMYFGGLGSGCCMEFKLPSGSRFNTSTTWAGVRHVFAVHKVESTYGEIFGRFGSSIPTPFMRSGNTKNDYIWYSAACWPSLVNGRTYRNGQRIDGTLATVGDKLQILEGERVYNVQNVVGGFFTGGAEKSSAGGDYLCEALAFTNRLDEAERQIITEYLMAKWLPGAARNEMSVHIAEGATLKVDANEADFAEPRLSLTGNGTLLKTGAHSFTYDNDSPEAFDGTVSMDEGSIVLRAPAAVAVSGPGTITSERTVDGPTVSVAAAAGGKALRKDGGDIATIRSIPSGVERVSMEAGTLSVRKAPSFRRDDVLEEVPLRDGGFEEYAAVFDSNDSGVIGGGKVKIANGGWGYFSGTCYVMDFDRWMELGKGMDSASLSAWNLYTHPPEGKCALVLRIGNLTTTDDTVVRSETIALEAGTYELRFQMSGRQADDYRGQIFRARFVGETGDNGVKAELGDVMYQDITDYTYCRLRTKIADAGNYRIELRTLHGRNGLIILDDMHLFKVKPSFSGSARWNIPGGDFETDSIPQGRDCKRFSVEHTHPGWTFTQSSAWTAGKRAEVGISTICTTNGAAGYGTGVYYNNSRRPATGSMELCFSGSGCQAETTFVPPAGTWQLQGDLARFGSYGVYPKVTATVTIDGADKDLGTLSPLSRLMGPMAWPKSFMVDGAQSVTLRLAASGITYYDTAASHGLLMDDLVLVGATDLELLSGGDCENVDSGNTMKTTSATAIGGVAGRCRVRTPNESNAAFGTRTIDGSRMVTIENMSILYEDVTLPFAGRYRLSFYAHSRLNSKTGNYQPNPLRAWIAADGVTNVIGYADTYNSEWVQRVFDFSVPTAGVWRVALQGCHNPDSASAIHEAHVDSISLKQIPEAADRTPPFPEKCKIAVAEGARLETDFTGTNTVRGLRLGAVMLSGIVEVADHPEYLGGRGAFCIVPGGTIVSFR